jgi:hypothetical protein
MAPDQVTTIAVMDLSYDNGKLRGRLQYYREPNNKKIHVAWDAQSQPKGYTPLHEGLVYYSIENSKAKLKPEGDRNEDPVLIKDLVYLWKESGYPPGTSLIMMILILPKKYSLTGPNPIPIGAKEFDGRLAVYWIPIADSNTRADVVWTLKNIKGDLLHEIRQINKDHSRIPKTSRIKTSNTDDIPSWFPMAGAIFGTITLLFLMSLIVLSLFSREIPTTSRFILVAFLALSIGLTSTFLGGTATAKGAMSLPFFTESPMSFAVTGGIAVFVIVLVLGNLFYVR